MAKLENNMVKVSRSDIFVRPENGGSWFQEFLNNYDLNKSAYPTTIQEVMNIITDKQGETVESVVAKYREQVGLDMVQSSDDEQQVKTASCASRPLSIRHAKEYASVVEKIEANKQLRDAIESLCKHSGGHKSIQSLVSFIRKELGEDVSFSDDHLTQYLTECKNKFKSCEQTNNMEGEHVGLVGLDNKDDIYEDDTADYMNNDGTK